MGEIQSRRRDADGGAKETQAMVVQLVLPLLLTAGFFRAPTPPHLPRFCCLPLRALALRACHGGDLSSAVWRALQGVGGVQCWGVHRSVATVEASMRPPRFMRLTSLQKSAMLGASLVAVGRSGIKLKLQMRTLRVGFLVCTAAFPRSVLFSVLRCRFRITVARPSVPTGHTERGGSDDPNGGASVPG